jgi:hypothetical protein
MSLEGYGTLEFIEQWNLERCTAALMVEVL